MASIVVNPGSMAFKVDTGEMAGDKVIYKTASLGSVRGDADPEALALIAEKAGNVLNGAVDQVTLRRTEILDY